MSKPISSDANDRAAALALSAAKAFLECLAVGRLSGVKNARRARKLARQAFSQHRRAGALLGIEAR